jgi:CheY-like chemotaxis protein
MEMTAASEPGYYDVILMDIQMPVMDGYTAAQAIRKLPDARLAGIPIIAMTANAFQEDIKKAEDAGMSGHIAKPLDIPAMKATLRHTLKG